MTATRAVGRRRRRVPRPVAMVVAAAVGLGLLGGGVGAVLGGIGAAGHESGHLHDGALHSPGDGSGPRH